MNLIHQIKNTQHEKLKIGRISYINVDPVYYKYDTQPSPDNIEIITRPPAELNTMMANSKLDISSVSTSAFARHSDQWMVLPDLSIACYGKVLSVLLVSRQPFEDLHDKAVLLTEESATAVDLVKLIFSNKGVLPKYQKGKVKSPGDILEPAQAGLVIGDAALKHNWENEFEHVWDLCEIWNQLTGLPFVFGLWAVRKLYVQKYPEAVLTVLEGLKTSKELGLRHLPGIVERAAKKIGIDQGLCRSYFNSMYYSMSQPEIECMVEFFSRLYAHKIIDVKPEIHFFNPIDAYQAMSL